MTMNIEHRWLAFVRRRLSELHPSIFGEEMPEVGGALTYFEYHRRLNELGFGADYSTHPRNPFYHENRN